MEGRVGRVGLVGGRKGGRREGKKVVEAEVGGGAWC